MRVLLLGGGGREHALAWKLSQSPHLDGLLAAPGSDAIAELAEVRAADVTDPPAVLALAEDFEANLVVVGPEAPLAAGVADVLADAGVRVFGPSRSAARVETSKRFAKEVMASAGVPTASWGAYDDLRQVVQHLDKATAPYVVKADGLAAGKGVLVTDELDRAAAWGQELLAGRFADAGAVVVVEDHLSGPELSVFALVHGESVVPFAAARDHKRLGDGDQGPNTGGMGAFSPVEGFGPDEVADLVELTIAPVATALVERGIPYTGFLYAGLVLTEAGPYVLEYNARLGDPETQVLLPLLDDDLVEIMQELLDGGRPQPRWTSQSAVNVVLAAAGYPDSPQRGDAISGLDRVPEDVLVFHAGTRRDASDGWLTAGGRVLSVVGLGDGVEAARARAMAGARAITFAGKQHRSDIGGAG